MSCVQQQYIHKTLNYILLWCNIVTLHKVLNYVYPTYVLFNGLIEFRAELWGGNKIFQNIFLKGAPRM